MLHPPTASVVLSSRSLRWSRPDAAQWLVHSSAGSRLTGVGQLHQKRRRLGWCIALGGTAAVAVAACLAQALAPAFLEQRPWLAGPSAERLPAPAELQNRLPLPQRLRRFVNASRAEVVAVLEGEDDRLIAIVGPCSIHDPPAAREYSRRLQQVALTHEKNLLVLMRTYLEKPRTSVGWRGLVSDPDLSGAENMERGIALGRRVLLDVNIAGLPAAVEFLDPLVAPYFEDLVTYGSIGARTVESPTHRALAASLPMPVGFKNARSGDVQSAVNAAIASASSQRRLAIDGAGRVHVISASGNMAGHIILRGGDSGPNYDNASVTAAAERLQKAGFTGRRVVVDCSHGNSGKQNYGQVVACESVADQVAGGSAVIGGVMIESFLEAGNQPLEPGVTQLSELKYGCSVTDACLDFNATEALLQKLANAVMARRVTSAVSWKEASAGSRPTVEQLWQ